jgi:hypothetical protein
VLTIVLQETLLFLDFKTFPPHCTDGSNFVLTNGLMIVTSVVTVLSLTC